MDAQKHLKSDHAPGLEISSLPFASREIMRPLGGGDEWGYVLAAFSRIAQGPVDSRWTSQDALAVNLILEGEVLYEEEGVPPVTLGPGSVFARIPRRRHCTRVLTPHSYAEFYTCVDRNTSHALEALHVVPSTPIFHPGLETQLLDACLALHRLLQDENASRHAILGSLMGALNALLVPGSGRRADAFWDEKVHAASRLLRNPAQYEMPLAEVARQLDVNYPTLRRIFHNRHGVSMGAFRIRARLEEACRLIVSSSVGEVARQLGYPDPFGFSAQFKKHVGLSPSTYRRRVATRVPAPPPHPSR